VPARQEPNTIIIDTCPCPCPNLIDSCVCACLRLWSCFYTANHRTTCNVDTSQVISAPSFFCHPFLPTTFAPSPLSHRRVAATCSPFAPAPHNMPSTIHVRLPTTLHVAYLSPPHSCPPISPPPHTRPIQYILTHVWHTTDPFPLHLSNSLTFFAYSDRCTCTGLVTGSGSHT
jgi:hypothetical protein